MVLEDQGKNEKLDYSAKKNPNFSRKYTLQLIAGEEEIRKQKKSDLNAYQITEVDKIEEAN